MALVNGTSSPGQPHSGAPPRHGKESKVAGPNHSSFSKGRRGRSSLFRHVLDGLVLFHGLLPITAIEFLSDHTPHSALIQAVGGDSEASRV